MAKRKEYLTAAEEAMRIVIKAYVEDNDKTPDSYAVLKAAFTRAYNKVSAEINIQAHENLGLTNAPWEVLYKEEAQIAEELKRIVKGF